MVEAPQLCNQFVVHNGLDLRGLQGLERMIAESIIKSLETMGRYVCHVRRFSCDTRNISEAMYKHTIRFPPISMLQNADPFVSVRPYF